MSAKFLDALGDEGSDLRRQIGCMTGILQMFDRQHIISGRRRSLPNQNQLCPGSKTNEPYGCSPQIVPEKTQSLNENQRLSMESSRNSFSSSSCSSSFSSLECNKSMLQENASCDPSTFSDIPLKDSRMSRLHHDEKANNIVPSSGSQNAVKICWQPIDFRDVVRDSIRRDSQGLSIKVAEKHKHKHLISLIDSPRTQLVDEAPVWNSIPKSRYLFEHEEKPRSSSNLTKDNNFFSPRLSYDERDNPRTSLDSQARTSAASRLRDLPRLSLDSRELSMQNSDCGSNANDILKELGRSISHGGLPRTTDINQDFRQKPHSVVAKLMGLEAMPSVSQPSPNIGEGLDTPEGRVKRYFSLNPSKIVKERKQDRIASPKSTVNVTIVPNRTISQSKIPTEPAPWRQPVKGHTSLKGMPGNLGTHVKQNHGSVYSEIQKKLKAMEFQPSNKDLRALKQILDAINAKGLLEVKKEEAEHTSKLSSNYMESCGYLTTGDAKYCRDIHPIQTMCANTSRERPRDSPIVIMKPASSINVVHSSRNSSEGRLVLPKAQISDATDRQDVSVNGQSEGDPTPRNLFREGIGHNLMLEKKTTSKNDESASKKPSKTSKVASRHQKLSSESRGGLMRSSNSWSPRMQQKKLLVDKKASTSSSLSSGKLQKPPRQSLESVSPRSKMKLKQKSEKMVSNGICEARNSNSQGDENSQRLNGSTPRIAEVDMQPRRSIQSAEQDLPFFHDKHSMSKKAADCATSTVRRKKDRCMRESSISAKGATTTSEQPSPVSVLDASLDKGDLSDSPVKDILFPSKDVCPMREINRRKHIENLVQKLEQLSSAEIQETQGNHIASLCETQNPDHHYVSEILLASGLLLENLNASLTAFLPIQLHHSGYPMNPELFLVLEQKKYGNLVKIVPISQDVHEPNHDLGRVKRRLMFDTVNEILVRKLDLDSTCPQPVSWLQATQLSKRVPSGQHLLKELCVEIENLENRGPWYCASEDDSGDSMQSILSRDMAQQSQGWTDLGREICGLVLDIERTIFKDLIDEVGEGRIAAAQATPRPRRRKLFT